MTQAEIIKTLHIRIETVVEAIRNVAEKLPSVKSKFVNGKLWVGTEFNLEETKAIYRQLNRNELEIILLEENWKDTHQTDVYTIRGTLDFLEKFKSDPYIQCCNTCSFLKGKTTDSKMPRPYCSLYEKYLENFNAKVYEDWCNSYKHNGLDKPKMWFKENAPHNLNVYGETGTVNGIKNEDLQGQRKSNEPIRHVGQIGF